MVLPVLPGGLPKRKFAVLPFLGRVSEREELSEECSLFIGPGEGGLVMLHEALVGVVDSP